MGRTGICRRLLARTILIAALAFFAGLAPDVAQAFRCGSKLVVEGMHEQEVIAICGEPETRRQIGYAIRPWDPRRGRPRSPGWTRYRDPAFGHLVEEVVITEFVYNFGPRRLMQRLVFEGGLLARIEALGYGH